MKQLLTALCLIALLPLSAQMDSTLADTTWMVDQPQKAKTGLVIGEGESVTLQAPSDSNVALMGGEVVTDAPVWADLMILGGDIDVHNIVSGDVTITGGRVRISKPVGEDVHVVGGNITITDSVYGNVMVVGGRVHIGPKAVIMGDALLIGGQIEMEGEVHGKVQSRSGQFEMGGTIHGSLNAKGGELALNGIVEGPALLASPDIDLGEGAQFHGNVRYWTHDGKMDFGTALMGGTATYDETLKPDWNYNWKVFGVGMIIFWILTTLGGILLMALVTLVFPDWIHRAGEKLQEAPLKSLGIGFLYFLIVPLIAGVLFISLIGMPIGFIVVFLYGLTVLYSLAFAAMAVAGWFGSRSGKEWKRYTLFGVSILVFIVLRLISLVPILGWIVGIVIVLIAFGGLISGLKKREAVPVA